MKIVFVSNFMNHHQLPFCLAMSQKQGVEFTFVATTRISKFRLELGYEDMNEKYDFVLPSYKSRENFSKAIALCEEADILIFGSASKSFIKSRLKKGKITFKLSERIDKIKPSLLKLFFRNITIYFNNGWYKSFYLLSASAYAATDYAKAFSYLNKAYKWGYFPEVKKYDDINNIIQNKKPNTLLWVARLIELKHPEVAVEVAKRLKADGYDITLNIIGEGNMLPDIIRDIHKNNLEDSINVLGSMTPEQVREHMENSQIFLFTSDRQEGWGAVLNESMNSGCAVVADSAIGSVPFLVKNRENGFIYKDGDIDDLVNKVKYLLDNPDVAKKCGAEAYKTLLDEWNAENAADRLIALAKELLKGNKKPNIFEDGVCSKDERLKDGWF